MITVVSHGKKKAEIIISGDEIRKIEFQGLSRYQHLEIIKKGDNVTRHIRRIHQGHVWVDAYGTRYRYNGVSFQIFDLEHDTQAA
ncbi:MAG: hypothetical protein HY422_01015 [Candidatus Komeilibacteria bacterium]|nr:hypothetical protein [Candidatus Komeilibacteria bacterium]